MSKFRQHLMNRRATRPLLLIVALLAFSVGAFADTCIDVVNTGVPGQLCYTVTNTGGTNFELQVTSITIPISTDVKTIIEMGWMGDAELTGWDTPFSWTDTGASPPPIDGFGAWDHDAVPVAMGSYDNNGLTTFTFNGDPDPAPLGDLVFHIQYSNGATNCSLYISNRVEFGGSGSPSEGCGTQVPEPTTLSLMGTGLVMLGGTLRKRLLKRR